MKITIAKADDKVFDGLSLSEGEYATWERVYYIYQKLKSKLFYNFTQIKEDYNGGRILNVG